MINKKYILFCDLKRQYHSIESNINNTINKVLSSGNFILGEERSELKSNSHCPLTEEFSKMILSLPLYSEMMEEEVYYISNIINRFQI